MKMYTRRLTIVLSQVYHENMLHIDLVIFIWYCKLQMLVSVKLVKFEYIELKQESRAQSVLVYIGGSIWCKDRGYFSL
jgi:hypothetical protein